jgi:hypothetical protein
MPNPYTYVELLEKFREHPTYSHFVSDMQRAGIDVCLYWQLGVGDKPGVVVTTGPEYMEVVDSTSLGLKQDLISPGKVVVFP